MASDVSHSSSEKWMVTGDEEKGVWEEETSCAGTWC